MTTEQQELDGKFCAWVLAFGICMGFVPGFWVALNALETEQKYWVKDCAKLDGELYVRVEDGQLKVNIERCKVERWK